MTDVGYCIRGEAPDCCSDAFSAGPRSEAVMRAFTGFLLRTRYLLPDAVVANLMVYCFDRVPCL